MLGIEYDPTIYGYDGTTERLKEKKAKFDAWKVKQNMTGDSALDILKKIGLACEDMVLAYYSIIPQRQPDCTGAKPVITENGRCWILQTPEYATGQGMCHKNFYGEIFMIAVAVNLFRNAGEGLEGRGIGLALHSVTWGRGSELCFA